MTALRTYLMTLLKGVTHDRRDINCVKWDGRVRTTPTTCDPCLATGGYVARRWAEQDGAAS